MGERSKHIGELGEEFGRRFLEKLGWIKLGDWNDDIPCESTEHKNLREKTKKTHGIDGVYCYTNPYTLQLDVILIEAKALSWNSGAKSKAVSTIGTQLNGFVEAVSDKAACALRSSDFKSKFDLSTNWGDLKVALIYYGHDGYRSSSMPEVRAKVSMKNGSEQTPVFLIDNDVLQRAMTALNFLSPEGARTVEEKPEFFNPELVTKSSKAFWTTHLPIEYLYSSFFVARFASEPSKGIVFYQGTYSQESIRRLFAGLGKFQILATDSLVFVPLNANPASDDRHALESLINNGVLETADRKQSLELTDVTQVVPTFPLKAKP